MKIVSVSQKKALERIAGSDRRDDRGHAHEILRCIDHGVVPNPAAVEWFLEWLRVDARSGT